MKSKITVEDFYKEQIEAKPKRYKYKKVCDKYAPTNLSQVFIIKQGRKKKILVFLHGLHEITGHTYIDFLENSFKKIKAQILLLEHPNDLSIKVFKNLLKKKEKRNWNEIEWGVYFSIKNKNNFKGMDLGKNEQMLPFFELQKKDKNAIKGGILLYALWLYRSYRHRRGRFGIEKSYKKALSEMKHRIFGTSKWPDDYKSVKQFIINYKKQTKTKTYIQALDLLCREAFKIYVSKKPILDIIDDQAIYGPYPFRNKYKINKLNTWWKAYRNFYIANECVKSLKKHDRVLAQAGGGHIQTLKKSLKKMLKQEFGDVEMISWKEYIKKN